MTKDKERDDALIARAHRLTRECGYSETDAAFTKIVCETAIALLRGDEQPKPDRAEVLFDECGNWSKAEQLAIIRRHFDELRAEWEAERPAVVVPENVAEAAEWIWAHKALSSRENLVMHFIRSLDGAKGGA